MFLETIRIEEGHAHNIALHQERLDNTLISIGSKLKLNLSQNICVPSAFKNGRVKCRLVYDQSGILEIKYNHYKIKKINSLQLVEVDFNYLYKSADRSAIAEAYSRRNDCDDILMVKNGVLTDTSYANIVLQIDGQLFTPKVPLLNGTKRKELLLNHQIKEHNLTINDLEKADCVYLINAMLDLGDVLVFRNKIVSL